MAHEFSEAGRKARFEQWEKLGPDRVKNDLERDPYRLIGSGDVQTLAWEWVRMKEAEQRIREKDQEAALALGQSYPRSSDWADQPLPEKAPEVRPAPTPDEKRAELFIFKPNFHGIGVDVTEAGRRARQLIRRFWRKNT